MKPTYTFISKEGKYKCNICGKLVAEYGWQGHNRVHREGNIHKINKHIDTY